MKAALLAALLHFSGGSALADPAQLFTRNCLQPLATGGCVLTQAAEDRLQAIDPASVPGAPAGASAWRKGEAILVFESTWPHACWVASQGPDFAVSASRAAQAAPALALTITTPQNGLTIARLATPAD